ncbi:cell wall-associated NlpC family hydrolase [Mariniflexile fucanivorans]|uniref:Cell wall-associated NlpC family hydrolase n=1 Tax=Mariniflexile fucanivorans TaxID=264023 RepID=A0A4R1RIQ7_9FLAO|nr:C40 family peptidase [Mariniflexile fucanivorans]TCL65993.1 cell wall-associated NlpC family hydrolase [Mariniflexile fucanivorans]
MIFIKNITIILLAISLCFTSCKSSKSIVVKKETSSKTIIPNRTSEARVITYAEAEDSNTKTDEFNSNNSKAFNIIDYAKQFNGVRYKFGGATRDGMDCSGLVFESFRAFDVILPRISRDMAKQGEKVTLKNTQEGDLLFFKTMNRRNDISHVGLVVTSENGDIEFIHSTTSAGVIVSKLSENYWNNAFVEARRIL